MVIIAIRTVTGLNRPITAASLIFVMVTITVSIAVGRVILNVFTMNDRFYTTYATIPLQLFAELETFFAAIVSCLPGLRVLIRQRREADNPPYVENTVIVPDHEMSDMSDSTRYGLPQGPICRGLTTSPV